MAPRASRPVLKKSPRRVRFAIALGLVALLVAAAAGSILVRRRARAEELRQAREALTARRFGLASQHLGRLAESGSDDGEVLFLLGKSEMMLGKRDAALAAWSRVPASSPYFGKAVVSTAAHFIDAGQYADAESTLLAAWEGTAQEAGRHELELELSRLYRLQGRFRDVRTRLRASWCRAPNPMAVLKELWTLESGPRPLDRLKRSLTKAAQDDDRVWLGWANHAILSGEHATARTWLERCLSRRPDDPAVWQAGLDRAMAAGDVSSFWTAVAHLPATHFDECEILAFRVWLAAANHDADGEARELARLIACAPGDAQALERLAVLKVLSGRPHEAEVLHRRRDPVNLARETSRNIFFDGQDLSSRAGVLADCMAKLSRVFDAQAWSIVAEAGLRDQARVAPGTASDAGSPLPASLRARATALSASYEIAGDPKRSAGPVVADCLADLRPAVATRQQSVSPVAAAGDGSRSGDSSVLFVDDAFAAGLRFQLESGHTAQHLLPETMSGGVGLVDVDHDGWLDVYCVQGGALSDGPDTPDRPASAGGDRLFRNSGDGTFENVSVRSGIDRLSRGQGYGHGVAVGDFDNDGDADLFVSRLTTYALYRNRGDGTFDDVTTAAGLAGRRDHPTSAAFADLDNDGDLDLYVCHYTIWDPAHPMICQNGKGMPIYCHPSKVPPAADHVFRNDGGRFVDVTAASGCAESLGRGMGVVAADLDGDHRIDLFVANDTTPNYLFHNRGGFQFVEMAVEAGVAASVDGGYQAGMGVACGDLDGDGRPDLMVTNFYGEGTSLFHNLGSGLFTDRSTVSGIAVATRYLLGFGIAMADVTNHGRLDVMMTNGHVGDNRPTYPYAMPCRLYENRPDGRLVDISEQAGAPWQVERVGRGLAAGDLDNDGRVDALVVGQNDPLAYFHNRSQKVGHFVMFGLEGTTSNRDGVGASITVTAGGRKQVAQRTGGGSYQSANDPRLHFGLGAADRVDSVEVEWPSRHVDRWTNLSSDTGYLLRERAPQALSLRGFGVRAAASKGR
jgi:thioredoxin-like negative regulator of GroEL